MPIPPWKAFELQPALLALGCEVTAFDLARDTIAIAKPKRKKESKKKSAKRFSILRLMNDEYARLMEREPKNETPEDRAPSTSPPPPFRADEQETVASMPPQPTGKAEPTSAPNQPEETDAPAPRAKNGVSKPKSDVELDDSLEM